MQSYTASPPAIVQPEMIAWLAVLMLPARQNSALANVKIAGQRQYPSVHVHFGDADADPLTSSRVPVARRNAFIITRRADATDTTAAAARYSISINGADALKRFSPKDSVTATTVKTYLQGLANLEDGRIHTVRIVTGLNYVDDDSLQPVTLYRCGGEGQECLNGGVTEHY